MDGWINGWMEIHRCFPLPATENGHSYSRGQRKIPCLPPVLNWTCYTTFSACVHCCGQARPCISIRDPFLAIPSSNGGFPDRGRRPSVETLKGLDFLLLFASSCWANLAHPISAMSGSSKTGSTFSESACMLQTSMTELRGGNVTSPTQGRSSKPSE